MNAENDELAKYKLAYEALREMVESEYPIHDEGGLARAVYTWGGVGTSEAAIEAIRWVEAQRGNA